VRCFLFLGARDALLVDTCTGEGDLKAVVEGITKLPVIAVFTHADRDHIGAAKHFERRFMHPCEFDYYAKKSEEPLVMSPLWEGDILDIGTYRFEVILLPGHTPGSIALLEREKRFLVGGDSVQTGGSIFMFGDGRNFEAYRASMGKLQEMMDTFDVVYSSHYDLAVKPEAINRLHTAADKMIRHELTGTQMERYGVTFIRYESDGVSFFGA
jgi:glyoxylase-like metal-dependent hydrolase (beta-lactamase superfamily II)